MQTANIIITKIDHGGKFDSLLAIRLPGHAINVSCFIILVVSHSLDIILP